MTNKKQKRVYLVNPPFLKNFMRTSRCSWVTVGKSNWYPIFLGYATGLLEKEGHDCKLVDAVIDEMTHEESIDDIVSYKTDLLVLYTSYHSLDNEISIASKIKEKDPLIKIVMVGPWCSYKTEEMLSKATSVDAIVRQELELCLKEIASGTDWSKIDGITYRDNDGSIKSNKDMRPLTIKELDDLPFVTSVYKKHLDIKKYYQTSLLHPYIDLLTSRGCQWGHCTYCLWPHTIHKDARYRERSMDNVIAEIEYIKKELPEVKEIFLQDDMLTHERARSFANALIEKNLQITWSGYSRANFDYELLCLLKKSGCRFLHIGFESINQQVLTNIKKGTVPRQMEQFAIDCKKAGIMVHADFVFGFPGETKDTIKETIAWAVKMNFENNQFAYNQPHPGTPMYDNLASAGYLTDDGWASYPHLSFEEMKQAKFDALIAVYSSPHYWFRTIVTNPVEATRVFRAGVKALPRIISKSSDDWTRSSKKDTTDKECFFG